MKKIWFFLLISCISLLFVGCKESKKAEPLGTGESLATGENLQNEPPLPSTGTITKSWASSGTEVAMSWESLSWVLPIAPKGLFPIELCNQIIAFNRCIISKAPIENQPVMKQQLIKALEPRKLLADGQLREVCQDITTQESFQEVVKHYASQGCVF